MTHSRPSIMLIDDNEADNYLHQLEIEDANLAREICSYEMAAQALADLASGKVNPDLIFLDINMPAMNGWEFLDAYQELPADKRMAKIVMMLTTSVNPDDKKRAEEHNLLGGFYNKPLTGEVCAKILSEYGFA